MKILAICEGTNFKNFTRRATFEAIARNGCQLDALCHPHIRNYFHTKFRSDHVRIFCRYRTIPLRYLKKYKLLKLISSIVIKMFWGKFFDKYDVVVFSSPDQYYFLPLCKNKKIFIVSDPFHLLGKNSTFNKEKMLIDHSDLIFTTSQQLKNVYLPKYFNHKKRNVIYWPNTVDVKLWDYKLFAHSKKRVTCQNAVLGFLGNLNEVTVDIDLLEYITEKLDEACFEIAGKINCKNTGVSARIKNILQRKNVHYLGYLPYCEVMKKVASWDIGLMLDPKQEISEYVHHNKIYQYLALGKPAVVQKTHNDYDHLKDVVFISGSKQEYVDNIQKAILKVNDDAFVRNCLEISHNNSSDKRAEQFIKQIKTHFKDL